LRKSRLQCSFSQWKRLIVYTLSVDHSIVYIHIPKSVEALSGSNGKQTWQQGQVDTVQSWNGNLYEQQTAGFCAMNGSNGKKRWCTVEPSSVAQLPIVANTSAIYVNSAFQILAYQQSNGKNLWTYSFPAAGNMNVTIMGMDLG
jgi:outer membrane protein assembly factor BamB